MIETDCPCATRMGYDVEYEITLYVDDQDLKETLYYDRGDCGWFGDEPSPDVENEGISDKEGGDWCITIADGTVDMDFRSEKFYSRYMNRMLQALKERVPSLHGYVSCQDAGYDIYWTITSKVRRYEREERALTAEARQVYEQSYASNTRKRRLGEGDSA